MVCSPCVMTGKVRVWLDRTSGDRVFARPTASDEDRHPAKLDKDLRSPTSDGVRGDGRAEHLHIPGGRSVRIAADNVNVIEFKCGIAHSSPFPEPNRAADFVTPPFVAAARL